MPKIITLADIGDAIVKNDAKWVILGGVMPQTKLLDTGSKPRMYRLQCGGCGKLVWVNYANLRKGVSSCCRACSKLPSMEKIRTLIKKYDQLWIPSMVHKTVKKHRLFWMKCGGCSKYFWVKWRPFSQGNCTGCRSCAKRNAAGSLQDPMKYYKHPLMKAWRRMGAHTIKNKNARQWNSFDAFKKWALDQGIVFDRGPVLMKTDKSKPFSESNCYWKHTLETGKNTARVDYRKGYG